MSALLGVACVALGSVVLGIGWFLYPDWDAILVFIIGSFAVFTGLELLDHRKENRRG